MGKKKLRAKTTSKGLRKNSDPKISNLIRSTWVGSSDQLIAKLDAFLSGKNVMLTIENPNPEETAKRFIRVPAKQVWGDFRERKPYMIGK